MFIEFQYESERFKPDVRNSPDVVRLLGVDNGFRHDGNMRSREVCYDGERRCECGRVQSDDATLLLSDFDFSLLFLLCGVHESSIQ